MEFTPIATYSHLKCDSDERLTRWEDDLEKIVECFYFLTFYNR